MINNKYLQLLRSYNRFDVNNFIYNVIAERITDSIDLINIDFDQVLEVGINDNLIVNFIHKNNIKSKIERSDVSLSKKNLNKKFTYFEIDIDNIKFKEKYYNLIFSNFFIHLTNNFEKSL